MLSVLFLLLLLCHRNKVFISHFLHFIILPLLSNFFYIYRKVPDILGTYVCANIEIIEMSDIKNLYLGLH